MLTRRQFIERTTTLLASGATLPAFLGRTALAAHSDRDERVLVVVQLTGGNDGLNTIIPYRDDAYHRARPSLRLEPGQVLRLDDTLGLHPEMTGLKRLYDQGWLGVVTNVGYPNPDRSHFRSMDIWHTADPALHGKRTGWLGRVADRVSRPGRPPVALHLGDDALPLALRAERAAVPSVADVRGLSLPDAFDPLKPLIELPRRTGGDELLFVQRVAVSALRTAERIQRVAGAGPVRTPYPPHRLAQRLQQIAQLIAADFGPRVYYTSLDGFDTHARQQLAHGPLLRQLGDSVAAFFDDLRSRGLADRVVLMTFSEFGRRVHENASRGTDHGAAAPMFVAGPAVRAGIHGGPPDLTNLLDGDIRHEHDFRRIYAAVLEGWLKVPSAQVLGRRFEPLPVLRGSG